MGDVQQEVREALDSLERIYAAADGFDVEEYEDPASGISGDVDLYRVRAALTRAGEEIGDETWTCPECAFRFGAEHEDEGGGYSCPNCAEAALRARVAELEGALTQASQAGLRAMDHVEEQARNVFALRARVKEVEEALRRLADEGENPARLNGFEDGYELTPRFRQALVEALRVLAASEGGHDE